MTLTLVAAYARNRVIGADGGIPWRIPEDFAHFKQVTMGGTLVMGRATYDSIGRPLPGRTTVVVTRDPSWAAEGVVVAHSLTAAIDAAREAGGELFIAGGAQIYELALPLATDQILTLVPLDADGDVRYPAYDTGDWVETGREHRETYDRVRLRRATD